LVKLIPFEPDEEYPKGDSWYGGGRMALWEGDTAEETGGGRIFWFETVERKLAVGFG
jgi:hypothetical protein